MTGCFKSGFTNLPPSAAQYLYFRTFRANPRRSESVSTKDLHPDGQLSIFRLQNLTFGESKSGVQTLQINLSSVLAGRRDDVEGHGQGAATVFQSNHRLGATLHRLQE